MADGVPDDWVSVDDVIEAQLALQVEVSYPFTTENMSREQFARFLQNEILLYGHLFGLRADEPEISGLIEFAQ